MSARNRDLFGVYREDDMTQVSALFVRNGRMIGQKVFPLIRLRTGTPEILSALLMQYYDGGADIPDEIDLPEPLEDADVLEEWLAEKRGKSVAIVTPKRGETLALLGIAGKNAENAFRTARLVTDRPEATLPLLAEKIQLRNIPRRIECFDISNISGKHAVGSMVTFAAGVPFKGGYRRFRIRTVPGADDYAMMYEVLKRRYEKRDNLPDLVMVDGGRGQLGVALAVLKDLAIEGPDVIALAKERDDQQPEPSADLPGRPDTAGGARDSDDGPIVYKMAGGSGGKNKTSPRALPAHRTETPGKGEDRVFIPGRKDPVYISRWPSALFLLQRIRDEAHRFAVSYHRKVKEKEDLTSLLGRIPGIGRSRQRALLTHFGDVKHVRAASIPELMGVEGIGKKAAGRIREFLYAKGPLDREKV